ncbi:MAG: PDZ domain-containing protein [Methylotenera sp.]
MLKKLLGLVFLVGLHTGVFAAENLYEKNYKAQNTSNLVSVQADPDTKMYVSNHKDEDNISMLENGYDMMGTSAFEAGDVAPELALQHAKAIKADTVLIYRKYGSAKTAASKIAIIKEAAKKNGGVIDEKDLVEEQTQYRYYASYWVKLPMPLLGVHIIKLKKAGEAEESAFEKGLTVLAVIKDSPAAKAGLMRGDVLLKINDTALDKPEELSTLARQLQGQNVTIEYEREGNKAATSAQINRKN